jgi:hypothetical protein
MTSGPPARLIDAVLMLYPAAVRQRFGPEIADLLACSSTRGATWVSPRP